MRRITQTYRKADEIVRDMRDRIVSGEFEAGARLPTRDALSERYGVSKVTVQRALEQLRVDGFVVPQGRAGTFVTDHCPHLTRYALLFPQPVQSESRNQFFTALALEAERMKGQSEIVVYYGFEGRAGFAEYDRLVADVDADRLAGLIFAANPSILEGTPLLERPGIPRAAVMTGPAKGGVAAIQTVHTSFLEQALAELACQGRRNPLVLMSATPARNALDALTAQAREHGITLHDTWVQGVSLDSPEWAERLVRLVLERPRDEWPDSVLVCDDNLLEHTTRGLVACGVRGPEDMHVVSLANFPWPTPSHLPVTRIGPDVRTILRACMNDIDSQRAGNPPGHIRIPSVHEARLEERSNKPRSLHIPNTTIRHTVRRLARIAD